MGAATASLVNSNSTDANFRAWGKGISDQLAAMGLVKTADTGQIDWLTVLTPSTTNQVRGFEMWRFADALQATYPVFIKIEYGSGAATLAPGIKVTVGIATDGAGNLTGTRKSTTLDLTTSGANSTSSFTCVFSGASNRIGVALWIDHTTNSAVSWFIVERVKDASGADTGGGIVLCGGKGGATASTLHKSQVVTYAGNMPGQESELPCISPLSGSSGQVGTDVIAYTIRPFNVEELNAVLGAQGYFRADFPIHTPILVTTYGAAHTYYPCGNNLAYIARGQTNVGLLLRYE